MSMLCSYEPKAVGCTKTSSMLWDLQARPTQSQPSESFDKIRYPLKSPEASNGLIGSDLKCCLSPLVLRHKESSGATFSQILWHQIEESCLCIDINLVLQKKAKGIQLTFRFND